MSTGLQGSSKEAEALNPVVSRGHAGDDPAAALFVPPPSLITRERWLAVLACLSLLSLFILLACLRVGAENIALTDLARILAGAAIPGRIGEDSAAATILLKVRLPRVLLSFMVGGCLAAVGVGLQALLRNPLADPYVLGISSGAALGAALAMLFGVGTTLFVLSAVPLFAFLGGLLSILLVYWIAISYGHLPVHTLLLAGVVLNAIFSAFIMFITSIMEPTRSFGMMAWLMGSLIAPDYPTLAAMAVYLAVGGGVLFKQTNALNLLTLGEDMARSLGVEVEAAKKTIFFTSALLTGAIVSASGLIGFVGMVVPHAVRLLLGPDHRVLLPASALVGGMFLTAADAVARSILAPAEIPVGVVTALAGGPVFIYLLATRKGGLR
ncbi:FecCD family ABC transporter permease [Candidatus Nitrospira bockiana]